MRRIPHILLLSFTLFLTACPDGQRAPDLDKIFAQAKIQRGKRPVIIVPAILGTEMMNPKTNENVWVSLERSKEDDLALPISPDISNNRDALAPRSILQSVKLSRFLPEFTVYKDLIAAMERYGSYKEGDWDSPSSDGARDTYYVYAYDWRRDNVENARMLIRRIDALRKKLGEPELKFNVIAHSMGGLVSRYAAMYGDADLPPSGTQPVPTWAGAKYFNKIFLFGTPNEGSMAALESFQQGYRVKGFLVKSLSNDILFTMPSGFQLLPHAGTARFFDEDLKPIDVDLYDPMNWKKFDWSAYSALRARAESNEAGQSSKIGDGLDGLTVKSLDGYLSTVLGRAKEFQAALNAHANIPPAITFFVFGSDCDDTLDAAVVVRNRKSGRFETFFTPRTFVNSSGMKITAKAMRNVLFAPGDQRVTRRSLLAETLAAQNHQNPILRKTLPVYASFFCEPHDTLPNNQVVQNNFLTALVFELAN